MFQLVSFKNTCVYSFLWIAIQWVCRIDTNRSDKISMHRDAPVNRYTPIVKQSTGTVSHYAQWEGKHGTEIHTNKTTQFAAITWQQGKSEGFESCDRPIVRKRPIWVKIGDVLSRVTLKFDGWPWKTIGHLSFAVSSFVQHFIAISEFKLELLSGNALFGSN